MKSGPQPQGYTIIEAMLFLIITAALLVSAIGIFNGRLGRTRFTQSVREFDSQLRSVLNDVSSGLYPNNNTTFACYGSGNGPLISSLGAREQGTNTNCIFLGKVVHFGIQTAGVCPDANGEECSKIGVYTVVGQRLLSGSTNKQVGSLAEAKPVAIVATNPPDTVNNPQNIDFTSNFTLNSGLHITKVINLQDNSNIGALGFISTLAQYSGSDLVSGAQKVQSIPVTGTNIGATSTAIAAAIKSNASFNEGSANPSKGILICLESGTSNQKGGIKIGGNNREIGTDVLIDSGEVATLC